MSLQVWLPLNGNLNNQGLSDVTVTNNGATVDNNGKIGKCYLVDSSKRISFSSFSWMTMKPANNFSFSCWVKGTTTGWLFACSAWELRLCPEYIKVHPGYRGEYPAEYNVTFDSNTWYHLAFTWKGDTGNLLLYLNGIQVASSVVPSSVSYDISSTFNLPYDGPRYLNDVRVYDHCLSAKEVKEIAKGLICHYKLSGVGRENLFKLSESESNLYNISSYTVNNNVFSIVGYGNCGLYFPYTKFTVGKTYTISFKFKKTGGTLISIGGHPGQFNHIKWYVDNIKSDINYSSGYPLPDNELEHKVSLTVKCASGSVDDKNLYIQVNRMDSTPVNFDLWDIKLEEGDVATPWCPNPADTLYSTLGFNDGIEYDCSGYGNNGTKAGDIAWNGDSPRYSGSYYFSTNSSYISTILNTSGYANSYTFSYWAKINDMNNKMAFGFGGDNRLDLYPISSIFCWNIGDGEDNPFQNNGTNVTFTSYNGAWHHYVITGNGNTTTLYIDGEKKGTAKTYRAILGTELFLSGWDTGTLYKWTGGNISDFRLYSTCLSAEDVKELYNVSASIYKSGVLAAYEFVEEGC